MRFISLTAIDFRKEDAFIRSQRQQSNAAFRNVEIEEDDLEMPVASNDPDERGASEEIAAPAPGLEPAGMYYPTMIAIEQIRELYPRKNGKSGTRVVFVGGAASLVKETFSEVSTMIANATAD